jgi:hypothetical protein
MKSLNPSLNAVLNLIGLVLVLSVNALANILPINGYNTGQVSGFYPNSFVPAGFTFGIWGLIYFLLIGFVVCSLFRGFGKFNEAAGKSIDTISPYFQLTCVLNAGWIVVWHYLLLGTSLVVMIAFLVLLINLSIRLHPLKKQMNGFYRFWIHHPFLVYLSWIAVATIANATALFVGIGWQGAPLSAPLWSAVLIGVAIVLGLYMVVKQQEPAYGFVLAWALFGIYSNQSAASKLVGISSAVGVSLILASTFTFLLRKRSASMN